MPTPDPPVRRETINRMAGPAYGWQVITAKGAIATIPVYDLKHYKRHGPYQWLNENPQLFANATNPD